MSALPAVKELAGTVIRRWQRKVSLPPGMIRQPGRPDPDLSRKDMNLNGWPLVIVSFAAAMLGSVVHCSTPHEVGVWRDALPELYYLPIVIAAINLGTRAGVTVAIAAGLFHVVASSIGNGDPLIRLLVEAALFLCVGILAAKLPRIQIGLTAGHRSLVPHQNDESLERAFPNPASVRQRPDFGQIVAGLVRRFRSPVASIDGALWLLEDSRLSKERHEEFVKIIRRESHHLERALSDIQEFTQPRKPRIRPVDIPRLLDDIVQLTGPREHRNLFLFRADIPPDLPSLNADPELLSKMLQNLAINAIQAMPEGGQLIWTVRVDKNCMIISLRDFGRGILPGIRSRIFDPFFTTRENGLGLGLTVARQIAVAHRGTISVDAIPDRGTSISVALPLDLPKPR